jgi:hypothetical protein
MIRPDHFMEEVMRLIEAVVTQDQWALFLGVWLVTHLVRSGLLGAVFLQK